MSCTVPQDMIVLCYNPGCISRCETPQAQHSKVIAGSTCGEATRVKGFHCYMDDTLMDWTNERVDSMVTM
jgi:hypothetical protein